MIHLIAIGYAKQALVSGSREQLRMQEYSKELARYHLIVFTRISDELPQEFVCGNLHVHGTHARTRLGMLWSAYKIGKDILRSDVEAQWVVSSQDPFETSIVARALARATNAYHHIQLHGDFYSTKRWVRESLLNRVRARYGLFALKHAEKIRVVSTRIKNSLVDRGIVADKITILPIAVSLQSFLDVGNTRTHVDAQHCEFIFVGRLAPEKNIDVLVDAFANVYRTYPQMTLRIVGDGPLRTALMEQVEVLALKGVVTFVPWTEDVPAELSKADVFVLPSSHEGHAIVLIEAMAAGLAIIATDVGCVGDCVRDTQEGLVVAHTCESLEAAIAQMVADVPFREQCAKLASIHAGNIQKEQAEYVNRWTASFLRT